MELGKDVFNVLHRCTPLQLQYVAPKIGVCPDYILGDLGKPAPNPIVYKTI